MKAIIIFATILLVLDTVYLFGAKHIHQSLVKSIQGTPLVLNKLAALLFYLIAGCAYVLLVRRLSSSTKDAMIYGAILGAAMYFTFDLTNKAIFTNFSWSYAIMDGLWGTLAVSLASGLAYGVAS